MVESFPHITNVGLHTGIIQTLVNRRCFNMNESEEVLITDWFRRARESQLVHYACGDYFTQLNLRLGIPTIILTTVVGSAVFLSLDNHAIGNYKIYIGMTSLLSSVLAALHTFLGYSQRAEKHRITATGYAAIRRDIEFLKTFSDASEIDLSKKLEKIKLKMDYLTNSSEPVPKKVWRQHVSGLKDRDHHRVFQLPKRKIENGCS